MTRSARTLVAVLACLAGLGGFSAPGAAAVGREPTITPASAQAVASGPSGCTDANDQGRTTPRTRSRVIHARAHRRASGHAVEAPAPGALTTVGRADRPTRACSRPARRTRHHNTRAPPRKEGPA